jgi:hypothetical protein
LLLLEPGDVVLADKGFPQIKTLLNDSGRGALLVILHFCGMKFLLRMKWKKRSNSKSQNSHRKDYAKVENVPHYVKICDIFVTLRERYNFHVLRSG